MHFASPHLLWLSVLVVPMIGYYVWRTLQGGAAIRISSLDGAVGAPRTVRWYLRHLPFVLRATAPPMWTACFPALFNLAASGKP